ncbi:hypothetical protein CC2G_014731 [Coprinopsis cinerea AmutBmut pab1-1]|nr:hypothetical protein CC2G_014731 [Coprinopsis cinerea AmutBmut pab1-1]
MGPRLRTLFVSACTRPDNDFIIPPGWDTQDEPGVQGDADHCSAIASQVGELSEHLTEFDFAGPVTTGFFASIADLRKLTTLRLTPSTVNRFQDLQPLNELSVLETLELNILQDWQRPPGLSMSEYCERSRTLPNLRVLQMVTTSANVTGVNTTIAPGGLRQFSSFVTDLDIVHYHNYAPFIEQNQQLSGFAIGTVNVVTDYEPEGEFWNESRQEELLSALLKRIRDGTLVEIQLVDLPVFSKVMIRSFITRCLARQGSSRLIILHFTIPHEFLE